MLDSVVTNNAAYVIEGDWQQAIHYSRAEYQQFHKRIVTARWGSAAVLRPWARVRARGPCLWLAKIPSVRTTELMYMNSESRFAMTVDWRELDR